MGLVYCDHYQSQTEPSLSTRRSSHGSTTSTGSASTGDRRSSRFSSFSSLATSPEPTFSFFVKGNSLIQSTDHTVLRCKHCHSHICANNLIISNNFNGNYGPALFVSSVLNVRPDENVESRKMFTGRYRVKTIYCRQCDVNLGWEYLYSEEEGEKYKEGKYVVELSCLEQADS